MPKGVKPLGYEKHGVGKRIKSSKKRHSWRLEIEGDEIHVDLYVSKMSGKRKIVVNGDIRHQSKKTGGMLQYPFVWKEHNLNVIQQGNSYDLRIDSVSFEHLFLQAKNQEEFGYENQSPKTSYGPENDGEFNAEGFDRKENARYIGHSENLGANNDPPTQFKPSNFASSNPFDQQYPELGDVNHDMFKEQELKPMQHYETWGTLEGVNEQKPKQIGIRPPEPQRPGPIRKPTAGSAPAPASAPITQNIFVKPEIKQTRTQIADDLFETPSLPNQNFKTQQAALPDFPQSSNPFDLFEAQANQSNSNPPQMLPAAHFNTGMPNNYYMPMPPMNQFYTSNAYYYPGFMPPK